MEEAANNEKGALSGQPSLPKLGQDKRPNTMGQSAR